MSCLHYGVSASLVAVATIASAAAAADSPSPVNATITDRVVTFRWPKVEGAGGYAIQVRYDREFADDGRSLVYSTAGTKKCVFSKDLAALREKTVGRTLYWGVQPKRMGSGRQAAPPGKWLGPYAFTYKPTRRPVPATQIAIRVDIQPAQPVADGKTEFHVVATVTDLAGKPVVDEPVQFVVRGYLRGPDGTTIGGDVLMKRGLDYAGLHSGGFPVDGGISNMVDGRTNDQGVVMTAYRPPKWAAYMEGRPIRITAWYHFSGRNPRASSLVSFRRPWVRLTDRPPEGIRASAQEETSSGEDDKEIADKKMARAPRPPPSFCPGFVCAAGNLSPAPRRFGEKYASPCFHRLFLSGSHADRN
jgi:hypothetical protein